MALVLNVSRETLTLSSGEPLPVGSQVTVDETQPLEQLYLSTGLLRIVDSNAAPAPNLAAPSLIPDFKPFTTYPQGYPILHGGVVYQATAAFTSGASFSAGNWTAVSSTLRSRLSSEVQRVALGNGGPQDNPTITLGTANGNSAITGAAAFTGYSTLPNDARIRVLGTQGPLVSIGGSAPFNALYLGPLGVLASVPTAQLPFEIEFEFYGDKLEVAYFAGGGTLTPRLWVNGVLQQIPANPADGSMRNLLLDWSAAPTPRAIRRIRFTNAFLGGFYHAATCGLLAPSAAKGPRLVVAGDSFTVGATNTVDGIATSVWQAAKLCGIRDVWGLSVAGTGYLQSSPNLVTRFAGDVPHLNPDVIVIPMGLNDSGQVIADVVTAAQTVWGQALATGAVLVVVGPWACPASGGSPGYATCAALDTALQAAAAAMPGVNYISPIQEQWITGTGYQGATNGSGTSDFLIYTDGTHPNQAGHEYLGRRLAGHLSSLLWS